MVHTTVAVAIYLTLIFSCASQTPSNDYAIDAFTGMEFDARGYDSQWVYKGTILAKGRGIEVLLDEINGTQLHRKFYYSYPSKSAAMQTKEGWQCVSSDEVPPLHNLLNSPIRTLAQEEVSDEILRKCSQTLYHITFTNHVYVLCVEKTSGKAAKLFGKEFHATFTPAKQTNLEPPKLKCGMSTYAAHRQHLTKDNVIDKSHQTWWASEKLRKQITQKKSVAKTSSQRHCIFIHGSGQSGFSDPTSSFTDYWGNLHSITPQCSTRQFLHMETIRLGWNNPQLHKIVCDASTFDQQDKFLIKNKIIFSHSMGNLILASAIQNKICDIDASTSWYTIARPANGSSVAVALNSICADNGITKAIAVLQGVCVDNKPGQAYITLNPNFPGLAQLYNIFERRIAGNLCGTSAQGLTSPFAAALTLVSKIAHLETPNDGLVWYDSCNIVEPGIVPTTSPTSKYYNAGVNHADATCRNGDGWWGNDRQPCTWYTNME